MFLRSFARFFYFLEEPDGRKEQIQEVCTEISLTLSGTSPGLQLLPLSCQFGGEKCDVSQAAAAAAESSSYCQFSLVVSTPASRSPWVMSALSAPSHLAEGIR